MSDSFWREEGKALGVGITLFVATDPSEEGQRNLGRVRDIINLGKSDFDQILLNMLASENSVVRSTAMRTASKDEKLLSNVRATLQAQTHFLDSPRIRKSLSRSDFRFEDLKTKRMTVYIVLPTDRIKTFRRWMRLLVQLGLTANARNIEHKPDKPILFMLDEMAALGKLSMVEQAYGLMAGFGMQLWSIVQDVSQLERIYGKGWETFISNSGVLQSYGSRDWKTAEYFSKLAGMTTVDKASWSKGESHSAGSSYSSGANSGSSYGGGRVGMNFSSGISSGSSTNISSGDSKGRNHDVVQRPLILPDEIMKLPQDEMLLFVENLKPIKGFRIKWFSHDVLKQLGKHLHTKVARKKRNGD